MEGLFNLWSDADQPSEAAYKLCLGRLRQKPRTHELPTALAVRGFRKRPKGNPAWYSLPEVVHALHELALDPQALNTSRSAAIEALGGLKAVAELRQIKAHLVANPGPFAQTLASDAEVQLKQTKSL